MHRLREFQALTNGGRLVRVIREHPFQGPSLGVYPRPRYLLDGQPLTELNDGYLALPGSGVVMKLVAQQETHWQQWTWHLPLIDSKEGREKPT